MVFIALGLPAFGAGKTVAAETPFLSREINRNRPIKIVFDSGVVIKPQVLEAVWALASWIQAPKDDGVFYSPGDVPNVVFIPSELNGEKKGADDFIVRHGTDAFARLLRLARPAWIW